MAKKKSASSSGILIIVIVIIAALALVVWGNLPFLDPVRSFLGLGPNITSGEVVEKLRATNYLTTTRITLQVVVRSDTPGNWWALGQDYKKMLLVAQGTVEAGLDLNQLDAADVVISDGGKNITVTLPPVMIRNRDSCLSNDPNETYVYDASSGWLADTTNQQTELRGTANDALVNAACESGIMQRATTDARLVIERLMKTLAPDASITIVSGRIPTEAECKAK